MTSFNFNNLCERLPSPEEQRLYARDMCMLSVTGDVIAALEEAGMSRAELAERVGRTKGFVSQVLSGSRNMTLGTLSDMLWAVGKEVRGLTLRPLGEMRVPSEAMDAWLESEGRIRQAHIGAAISSDNDLGEDLESMSEQPLAA